MSTTDRREFLVTSAAACAAMAIMPELSLARPLRLREPLPVAVIGTGRHGRAVLAELQKIDQVTVAAICDTDESRRSSGGRRARGADAFATHAELLAERPEVRAVFVTTPTHTHREVAMAALAAGRHVYCAGPLAATVEDCHAMAREARGAETVFQSGLHGRSNPVYKLARSFYRAGSLRELVSMRAQDVRKTSWRMPGGDPDRDRRMNWRLDPDVSLGLAGELGTQQFDVVQWFVDAYPVRITGGGATRLHDDGRVVPDTIHCTLEFSNGAALQYQATLASSYDGRYELLRGSMATMKLAWSHGWMFKEADAATQGWEVYANRQQFHDDEGITLIAEATKLAAQGKLKEGVGLPQPPLYYAIEDFLKSVTEDEPVACSAEEGMRSTIVGILANRAVMTGEVVGVDPEMLKT